MPQLDNPRHEAYCQSRAKGFSSADAYEDAGFAPGNGHGSRLSRNPEVKARTAELRGEQVDISGANLRGVVAALLRLSAASENMETAGAIKEGRETLLQAHRLAEILVGQRVKVRLHDDYE